jgi:hypothetical protein
MDPVDPGQYVDMIRMSMEPTCKSSPATAAQPEGSQKVRTLAWMRGLLIIICPPTGDRLSSPLKL